MNSGEGKRKRGKGKLFGSPPPSENPAGAKSEDRTLGTLSEYMGSEKNPEGSVSSISPGNTGANGDRSPTSKELLPQEWEIEESGASDAPSEEDILQRLDRLEKRLDAFENTTYTFLLYARQLTDRTVSFFEDIFGLSSGDLAQIHDRLGVNYNNKGDYPKAVEAFRKLVEIGQTPASCSNWAWPTTTMETSRKRLRPTAGLSPWMPPVISRGITNWPRSIPEPKTTAKPSGA